VRIAHHMLIYKICLQRFCETTTRQGFDVLALVVFTLSVAQSTEKFLLQNSAWSQKIDENK